MKTVLFPKLTPLIHYLDSLQGEADLPRVQDLLEQLDITVDDLKEACRFGEKTYQRNYLARSSFYDLMLLCWRPGQASPIHDHSGSSCGVKVLLGTATEIVYRHVDGEFVAPVKKRTFSKDHVCTSQITDIHNISNDTNSDLITIHLYSPPLHMNYYTRHPSFEGVEAVGTHNP